MAKRSTIGENPLDAVLRDNPLDTVVPEVAAAGLGRQRWPEIMAALQGQVEALSHGLAQVQAEMARVQDELRRAHGEMPALQKEVGRLNGEVAALKGFDSKALAAEMAQVKSQLSAIGEHVARFMASSRPPSDLPWWMGKKKA